MCHKQRRERLGQLLARARWLLQLELQLGQRQTLQADGGMPGHVREGHLIERKDVATVIPGGTLVALADGDVVCCALCMEAVDREWMAQLPSREQSLLRELCCRLKVIQLNLL